MYQTLLLIHSWTRWAIVVLVAMVVISALMNKMADAAGRTPAQRFSILAIIAIDIQLVIGLMLYVLYTPHMANLLNSASMVMKNKTLRYWSVEHIFGMIVLTILAHIGRAKVKRAATAAIANKRALAWFGIVLAILLITMPWPFMHYARPMFRY